MFTSFAHVVGQPHDDQTQLLSLEAIGAVRVKSLTFLDAF